MNEYWCPRCATAKPREAFYTYNPRRRRGFSTSPCRACRQAEMRARYEPFLKRVQALKLAAGCADCGYRAHAEALDYDHRPGEQKVSAVSKLILGAAKWETIEAEIAKCDVVCANCHRVRTAERMDARKHGSWDLRVGPAAPMQLAFEDAS